ncbi:MAG: hypothetical protein HDQ96_02615 [Lachnospiraceae bacterium]|nr:hypothetical protein [Lachnospiraceae bacterium]
MKYIEIESAWNIFLDVISGLSPESACISSEDAGCADIEEACRNLACYSVSKDMEHGVRSKKELTEMEKSGRIANSHIFVRLTRHFYLLGVVERKDTKWLCDLLGTLHDFLGNQYYYFVDREIIERLLTLATGLSAVCCHTRNEYDKRMAQSARFLKEQGFSLSVKMGTISYSDETARALFDLLERKIATVGGNTVYKAAMEKYVARWYFTDMDRYLYGRKLDQERNAPFNLLLQLSAKHLRQGRDSQITEDITEYVDGIITLAEAFLDICDVQGTSGIEYGMMGSERFPLFLKNEMIFDKICVAQQYSARYILVSLDYLIKPWFEYAKRSYSYEDYYKVADYILKIQTYRGYVDTKILRAETGIAFYRLKQILKDISIPAKDVNCEFTSLDGRLNLFTRPVIAFPSGSCLFLDEHFCGIGFFYAACDMIRQNYPLLEREQGEAVEQMLRDEMEKKGYGIKYGDYPEKNGMKSGQCDLVLQNSKLAFLEVKKKRIADELDALDDVTVLENMAFGMIRAQKQCFFHESYLKSNREILFRDGQQKIICEEDSIPAYKISVCYPEYTFLTNKMFSMNLLEILLRGGFRTKDPNLQGKLDKLNQAGQEIRKCVISSNPGHPINAREESFYSLFCSMQQILTAVWWCADETEFFRVLDYWIHSTDKTLDPYISLFATKVMIIDSQKGSVREAMLECIKKRGTPTMIMG